MRKLFSLALLLLLPLQAFAQSVTLPQNVAGQAGNFIIIRPTQLDAEDVTWLPLDSGLSILPPELSSKHEVCVAIAGRDGTYRLACIAAKVVGGKAALSSPAICFVTVGTPGPTPVPPGPNPPKPDPPKPDPIPPSPPPIPAAGLHVLVVYETSVANDVLKIVQSKDVFDYLNARCAPDGVRYYDKDAKLDNAAQKWKDAMARPRTSIPWIIISNNSGGFEGPLPKTKDELLTLLKKYGG